MSLEFVCVVCDKTFTRHAIRGNYVQIRKLCDSCLEIHKWCSWGRHAPLRSRFAVCNGSKGDGHQSTCNDCLPYMRGRRPYTCAHCAVDFIPPIGAMHLNGRSTPLCEDCYNTVKHCLQCDNFKPHSEFGFSRDKATGLAGQCKDCIRKKWHALPEARRASPKLAKYGLTFDEYTAMRVAQSDLCAICGSPEWVVAGGKIKPLAIDHCHSTGRVRALLCHACNHALGKMADDPARLRAAADYLERWTA